MTIDVATIWVPEHTAPDPHAIAGLIAEGYNLAAIVDTESGHRLEFHRPRHPPRPPPVGAHGQKM
jgi:hypothetical protein